MGWQKAKTCYVLFQKMYTILKTIVWTYRFTLQTWWTVGVQKYTIKHHVIKLLILGVVCCKIHNVQVYKHNLFFTSCSLNFHCFICIYTLSHQWPSLGRMINPPGSSSHPKSQPVATKPLNATISAASISAVSTTKFFFFFCTAWKSLSVKVCMNFIFKT